MKKMILFILCLSFGSSAMAYDIIGKDDRKPLTAEQMKKFSFVGKLRIQPLREGSSSQKMTYCTATLVGKQFVAVSADCLVTNTHALWPETAALEMSAFSAFLKKNKARYQILFTTPSGEDLVMRTEDFDFSADYRPQQIIKNERFKTVWEIKPPNGSSVALISLSEVPAEISPIPFLKWKLGKLYGDASLISVDSNGKRSYAKDCTASVTREDLSPYKRGEIFFTNCDTALGMGDPLIMTNAQGGMVLYGLVTTSSYLPYLTDQKPALSDDEILRLLNQSCGEMGDHCLNRGASSNEIHKVLDDVISEINKQLKK